MKTRREWLDGCLSWPDAYEDYPFNEAESPERWAVIRHRSNQKIFAMFFEREGRLCLNVKCDPMHADLLRSVYPAVTPGFHMNHRHWNTIALDETIPEEEILSFIQESYDLTAPKAGRKKK